MLNLHELFISCCFSIAVIRSDTIIGDPLLQAPLWIQDREEITSLCYEVHGCSGAYFNLVSDECIVVNALYSQVQDLNVVSEIGIHAVMKDGVGCVSVRITQVGTACVTTLSSSNGDNMTMSVGEIFNEDGVQVRQQNQYRVRISVPNCEQVDLVMWATCEINDNMPMMRFNISRGVNLRSTSHGLLGKSPWLFTRESKRGERFYVVKGGWIFACNSPRNDH